jgi:hypothetical protein
MMRWVLIALLGLAVAALVSLGASDLTSQPVGLSSEPLTAGDQLAPQRTVTVVRTHTVTDTTPRRTTTRSTTRPTATTPPPAPPPAATSDDHGGRGGGRGGGDGDDD